MANPILEALLQKLAERSVTIPPDVNTSFSQPSQSNPYGVTFSPAIPNPALNFMANRQNPVDLGRIDVVKPPPAQTPQQLPQQKTAPQEMAGARDTQGSSAVMSFLKQLGLPIAATIAGVASESALPGAAGFNTGYASGVEKKQDRKIKEDYLNFKKLGGDKKPSKESLLKMAQTEANRQMGGGVFGQAKMASDPKFKQQYLDLVDTLYKSYVEQFRGDTNNQTDIDTSDELINQEWEDYVGGNL